MNGHARLKVSSAPLCVNIELMFAFRYSQKSNFVITMGGLVQKYSVVFIAARCLETMEK